MSPNFKNQRKAACQRSRIPRAKILSAQERSRLAREFRTRAGSQSPKKPVVENPLDPVLESSTGTDTTSAIATNTEGDAFDLSSQERNSDSLSYTFFNHDHDMADTWSDSKSSPEMMHNYPQLEMSSAWNRGRRPRFRRHKSKGHSSGSDYNYFAEVSSDSTEISTDENAGKFVRIAKISNRTNPKNQPLVSKPVEQSESKPKPTQKRKPSRSPSFLGTFFDIIFWPMMLLRKRSDD